MCLGCLSSILIFKILDLFQYAVFKVRCKNKICSAAQKACFLKRLTNFIFIACLHASEETQFPNCSVHSAIYLPPAPIRSRSASGDGEIRTLDPLLARQVLSQLSYAPILAALPQPSVLPPPMGLSGLEPPTSRLSGVRSNRLSYKPFLIWHPPALPCRLQHSTIGRLRLNRRVRDGYGCFPQPHRHQISLLSIHLSDP